MIFLKKLFSFNEFKIKGYTLKFNRLEKSWFVMKGHSIMYMGDESACRKYLDSL